MNEIAENIRLLKKELPDNVKLVAVSKTKTIEDIMEAYEAGHRIFGENRVQELLGKYEHVPGDIQWHMIGHLQRNKVKYIAGFIHLIESVDSEKLLREINKEGARAGRTIDCLLQFHIAREETKFGFSVEEARQMIESGVSEELRNVNIRGVMGMATFTEDMDRVRSEFVYLRSVFEELKEGFFQKKDDFCEISMGMSGDYKVALEEGSTMVRIGTAIFGARYCKIDN
ncbi:MAG TPA: YggS family pyridoxal phosphate-dependent enzyme [Bacteroidetes bacterium]|nr:YggS family pyridoxal phosphate-dependent enzyme [Bacteroidota bacterium]